MPRRRDAELEAMIEERLAEPGPIDFAFAELLMVAAQDGRRGRLSAGERGSLEALLEAHGARITPAARAAIGEYLADPTQIPVLPGGTRAEPFMVMFNEPFGPDDLSEGVSRCVRTAERTIDFVFYQIGDDAVIDALVEARRRGVKVRVVSDSTYYEPDETFAELGQKVERKTRYADWLAELMRVRPDAKRHRAGLGAAERFRAVKSELEHWRKVAPDDRYMKDDMPALESYFLQLERWLETGAASERPDRASINKMKTEVMTGVNNYRRRLKYRPGYDRLVAAGVSLVGDAKSPQSHNKFMVVDGRSVWMGSYNVGGIRIAEAPYGRVNSADNALWFHDEAVARQFVDEADEMHDDRRFGASKKRATAQSELTVGGASVSVYFTPTDQVEDRIVADLQEVDALAAAGRKVAVRIAAFVFFEGGNKPMCDALVSLARHGAEVRVLFGNQHARWKTSAYHRFRKSKIEARVADNSIHLHHKFISIGVRGGDRVWTGSANFTRPAFRYNDESVIRVASAEVRRLYDRAFERLFDRYGTTPTGVAGGHSGPDED